MSVFKTATFTMALAAAAVSVAQAAPVRHAGEWETVLNGGRKMVVCLPRDDAFSPAMLERAMSKVRNMTCATSNFSVLGPVMKVTMTCDYSGMHMVSNAMVIATGPDSYSSTTHMHTSGAMKMPNGRSISMPDQTMTSTSHRLGPCKPGDRVVEH